MIKVSVVVTVLNEEKTIEQLLTALNQQTQLPDEVVVVDGGSSDKTISLIKAKQKSVLYRSRLIEKKGNRSVGRNEGIRQAKYPVIAITDAGCLPHTDWLEELLAKYVEEKRRSANKSVVIAGYYDAKPQTPFEEAVVPYVLVMPDKVDPTAFLPATRSMLLDKSVWKLVGGFDEKLSHNEDYAFARQLEKNESIILYFTKAAKVTWVPRSNLSSFAFMIFRFAKGDAEAGIWRPKVVFIFARYVGVGLLSLWLVTISIKALVFFWFAGLVVYSCWAIMKNKRYVSTGWYWLPILQLVSDFEVMKGSLAGLITGDRDQK